MTKTAIIAPLGTSPPVITEFLEYVEKTLDRRVSDLVIIATKEPTVLEGVPLIETAVKNKYLHVHTHIVELPFTDIQSDEDNLKFMKICAEVLRKEKEIHKTDIIYLCVAGGRKDMCITLSLLAQYFEVNGVFHVITPDIKSMNIELERARQNMKELSENPDKDSYYEQHKKLFDSLMYPPPAQYNVINIPVLPYPQTMLNDIIRLLTGDSTQTRSNVKLPLIVLENMNASGLIKLTENNVYLTSEGRRFGETLKLGLSVR
ncbi:MAG: CRISPR-associated protein Csx14 [Candidatus Jordarchaeum sp.]|uniref:CRISPR-associated protein Csx14 n=1 Tax=Candidatus Jordarchaeum sp. TaxID=2823881 RepID=UPI00404920E3